MPGSQKRAIFRHVNTEYEIFVNRKGGERREKAESTTLSVLVSVLVIVVFSAFGLSLFSDTPSVVLPEPTSSEDSQPVESGSPDPVGSAAIIQVDVTVDTVQAVIATLERTESYQRALTVETFCEGGSSLTSVYVWAEDGRIRQDIKREGAELRHVIIKGDTVYVWYGSAEKYYTGVLGEFSSDGEQGIPTYEDVLALEKTALTAAGYVEKDGFSCIYVEAKDSTTGYVRRYWVDVGTGLLVFAETDREGTLLYRMSSQKVSGTGTSEEVFYPA